MEETLIKENPLGVKPVGKLLQKFAIPSIVAMIVSALYNIVDQIFIGHDLGEIGNAATNICFPFTISCMSIALMFGIGGASAFNLAMGEGDKERAPFYIGNSVTFIMIIGIFIAGIVEIFLGDLLVFVGSTDEILPYATDYARITAIGFPMMILSGGGAHLIRADGSPTYSMICNITGAVINTILDAVFIFGLGWGIKGAALATIIGQYASGFLVIRYLLHYKSVKLSLKHLIPKAKYFSRCMALGLAAFCNQLAMMIVQIVLNKSLKYYGALSVYGEAIPLACVGICTKVGMVFFSIVIGIAQGTQPIVSFNFGARNYDRVKKALSIAIKLCGIISIGSFLIMQLLPRQIIDLFGEAQSEAYYDFAVMYFRIYFFLTFINFLQPLTATFFSATGRASRGMFLSLTRQIIFLLPLLFILPSFFGIDGIVYAGPIADTIAAIVSITMLVVEFRNARYKAEK